MVIADELMQQKIPFGFVAGYGEGAIPERFQPIVRWQKPKADRLAREAEKSDDK
jgi:hypothetical protein